MAATELFPGFYRISLPIPRGGFESFLDGWFIEDEERGQNILVETGPASASPELLVQLASLGLAKIDYLIYTHIHLDHAGGAGHFMEHFPETKVLAPLRGRPHLVDPQKLISGSRESLGGLCDAYGLPRPVPLENILEDGSEIKGLETIETPGHAPHHSSYIYETHGRRILFPGEAAGCLFPLDDGDFFMRPATPHKFYYDTEMSSLDKLLALEDIELACFPHSGYIKNPVAVMLEAKKQLELWLEVMQELPAEADADEAVKRLTVRDPMLEKLDRLPQMVRERELFFLKQSAKGFLGWVRRG